MDRQKEGPQITQKFHGSYLWSVFYLFDRPSWEITKYNAIFLMCANKEHKYNCTLWSIFIQRVQGVWNFTKPIQMPLRSEADPRHTPLFTVSYWASVIPVLKYHPSGTWLLRAVEGAETETVIKNFIKYSSLCCYHALQVQYKILSPTWKNLDFRGSRSSSQCFLKLGDTRSFLRIFSIDTGQPQNQLAARCQATADPQAEVTLSSPSPPAPPLPTVLRVLFC